MINYTDRITLRVTKEEKMNIEKSAKDSGLCTSTYLRKVIFNNNNNNNNDESNFKYAVMQSLSRMSTLINKSKLEQEKEAYINTMEKEAYALWQIL